MLRQKRIMVLQRHKSRRTTRLAWLLPAAYSTLGLEMEIDRRRNKAMMPLLRKQVTKRVQKLLDKLVLKVAVKLIWKAAKKVVA